MLIKLIDVVRKLIGKTNSIGESNTDEARYKNLLVKSAIAYDLVGDLVNESESIDRYEYSRKKSGIFATKSINDIRELIEPVIEKIKEKK